MPVEYRVGCMRGVRRVLGAALLAVAWGGAQPAWAGRVCEVQPLKVSAVTSGLALAERTVKQLDASGAKVVVLARSAAWSTRLRYGLTAIAVPLRERAPGISKVTVRVAPPER